MITKRLLTKDDKSIPGFLDPRTECMVYEDESGPIMYTRCSKVLRLDIQFMSRRDVERNKAALQQFDEDILEPAKQSGYIEMIFNTLVESLAEYCKKVFGFIKSEGEYIRYL